MVITLNTNATQDAILSRLLTKTNADRAAQNPPLQPLADVPALVVNIMTNAVQSYRDQQIAEDTAAIDAAYAAGNAATRNAIKAAAGVP